MSRIIWYGVGKNLSDYEERFVSETGYPEFIVDRDTKKQGSIYTFVNGSECPIIAPNELVEKYQDSEIWITLADHNIQACFNYMTELGVVQERIRLFGNREYRLGCQNLNYYCYVQSMNVKTCAHEPWTTLFSFEKKVLSADDIRNKLDELEQWRADTIEALRNGEKTPCHGCAGLQYGTYTRNPVIRTFAVGPNFAGGTKCNADCFYCSQRSSMEREEKSIQELSNYDIHKIAADYYPDIEEIILADGEPTVSRDIGKIMDLAKEKKWSVQLNTNGIIFTEQIADTIASGKRSFVSVSLDSGTAETYKKIKRVDTFERVINNLRAYRERGCELTLKYIVIPGCNDTIEEISGFIDICKSLKCKHVTLSQNLHNVVDGVADVGDPNMPEGLFMLFTYFVARLQEEDIYWDFQIEFINKHDYERLEKLR